MPTLVDGVSVSDCSWCAGPTRAPGILLAAIANGRTVCVPCGRFQIDCECRPPVGRSSEQERRDDLRQSPLDRWIADRVAAGWQARAIATAADVSLRTAQRWVEKYRDPETVVVGGYRARYAVRSGRTPVRLEPWRPV